MCGTYVLKYKYLLANERTPLFLFEYKKPWHCKYRIELRNRVYLYIDWVAPYYMGYKDNWRNMCTTNSTSIPTFHHFALGVHNIDICNLFKKNNKRKWKN